MNDSILARAGWFAALGQIVLIPAAVAAQPASTQLGSRSEATIQIRVSVAPRFITNNRSISEAGGAINVTSNAPGLRYKVIAQRQQGMGGKSAGLQIPAGRAQLVSSSTLLLIVPD